MALRYGSKSGSALRYNPYSALALRYGSKIGWTSGGEILTPTDNSYFTFILLDDDTYSIAAADITTLPATVVLPDTYEGKAVTVIADNAFDNGSLKEVRVKSIYIPASITTIGYRAFHFCMTLTKIQLAKGSNLTSIGEQAFVAAGFNVGLTFNLEEATKLTTISERTFENAQLKKITIPTSVTTIEEYAFRYTKLLTEIVIPKSVTSMGYDVFDDCTQLAQIYCEAASQPSGWDANWNRDNYPVLWGYNCHKVGHSYTSEVIEPTCDGMGWTDYTCSKCGHYYSADFTPTLGGHIETDWIIDTEATPTSAGSKHTECTRCGSWVNSETIPILTTSEDYFTFTELADGTYSIKAKSTSNLPDYVVIPNTYNGKSVTQIADLAFSGATISKLYIHEGITSIGHASFNGCSNLVEANLPASVTSIGDQAFNGCSSLATFTIADNSQLTSIGEYAFNYCSALTSIVIPASVATIGAYAFRNCSNLTINCEASSKPSGWASTWVVITAGGNCTVNWGYTS